MRYAIALMMMCSLAIGQEPVFRPTGRYAATTTTVSEDGCYLVVFTASWCGPCQAWKRVHLPTLESAGHKVRVVDIEQDNRWHVVTVPTFWVVDRQTKKTVRTFRGATSAEELLPLLKVRQRTTTKVIGNTIRTVTRTVTRMSHSAMVALHNRLHGGGSWTWPGDLATHLREVHGVRVE